MSRHSERFDRPPPPLGPLFDRPKPPNTFGPDYDAAQDGKRLQGQHERIREYMLLGHGAWRTLHEIAGSLGYPEASVSAQLRHLKKAEFGGYDVQKRRRGDGGLWEYRVRPG